MNLGGHFTGAQLVGDLLVRQTADNQRQHLALTRCQLRRQLPHVLNPLPLIERRRGVLTGAAQNAEQFIVIEWFGQELHRAGLHRLHRHRNRAVAGHEYHRPRQAALVQRCLQLQACGFGQADVEQQARRATGDVGLEQFFGGLENSVFDVFGAQQAAQCAAHAGLIVNDEHRHRLRIDQRRLRHHRRRGQGVEHGQFGFAVFQ